MKVSIVVAAYNVEFQIGRCIYSIINQTFRNIEVIVVNDGCTDGTLNVINSILEKEKYKNIKIISQENKGVIEARRKGLNFATGEYILFVDGDDWLEIDAIEILYSKAKLDDSDVIVYNCNKAINDIHKKCLKMYNPDKILEIEEDPLKNLLLGEVEASIWSKFIKLKFIKDNNIEFPRHISFAEDLATNVSIFIKIPKISFVEKPLYNYYVRNDSITRKVDSRILDIKTAFLFIKEELNRNGIYNLYIKEFEYLVFIHLFVYRQYNFYNINIHRSLYSLYRTYNIIIEDNTYIKQACKNNRIIELLVFSYSKSYIFGYIIYLIINITKLLLNNIKKFRR